jgi:hypothetical protein
VRTAVAGCQSSPHKFRLTNSQAPIALLAIEIRLQWRAQGNECQSNAGGTVSYPVHDFSTPERIRCDRLLPGPRSRYLEVKLWRKTPRIGGRCVGLGPSCRNCHSGGGTWC